MCIRDSYHYCPTGVEQFKKAGRWSTVPEPGMVIFFTNGARAYHTGIVVEVSSFRIKTVEGNTSGASGVIENGGGVCEKSYSRTYGKILGYGLPDWSLVEPVKKSGWHEEEGGWRYYHGDTGESIRNDWHEDPNPLLSNCDSYYETLELELISGCSKCQLLDKNTKYGINTRCV